MLEEIRKYAITSIAVKKEYVRKWRYDCGPNIIVEIEKERKKEY